MVLPIWTFNYYYKDAEYLGFSYKSCEIKCFNTLDYVNNLGKYLTNEIYCIYLCFNCYYFFLFVISGCLLTHVNIQTGNSKGHKFISGKPPAQSTDARDRCTSIIMVDIYSVSVYAQTCVNLRRNQAIYAHIIYQGIRLTQKYL